MMKDSLLSHIASSFIPQYENVANSGVCYLLNKYEAAQDALKKIAEIESKPIRYITELSTKQNGRPDITGIDNNGNKSIIIEGKFWANLTDNQPENYLKELMDGGRLLFIAPEKRIESLRLEIKNRVGDLHENMIHICSWGAFLDSVELENSKRPNFNLKSDVVQLKQLCMKMDEEGMPPLSLSDLDPMNGRITFQLANLLDDCRDRIKKWDESDFKGLKATGWKLGYGFYFRAYGLGCQLYFSSYRWFMRKSHTPIWLTIADIKYKKSDKIYQALNRYDKDHAYDDKDCAAYAISLKPGMDKTETVKYVVNSTRDVISAVHKDILQIDK